MPAGVADRRRARFQMLEKLADYDDHLMGNCCPTSGRPTEFFADLARELRERLIVPVLIGSAERDHGVRRLLKTLRHDAPRIAATAARGRRVAGGRRGAGHPHQPFRAGQKLSLVQVLSRRAPRTARRFLAGRRRRADRRHVPSLRQARQGGRRRRRRPEWRWGGWTRSRTGDTLSAAEGVAALKPGRAAARAGPRDGDRRRRPQDE